MAFRLSLVKIDCFVFISGTRVATIHVADWATPRGRGREVTSTQNDGRARFTCWELKYRFWHPFWHLALVPFMVLSRKNYSRR